MPREQFAAELDDRIERGRGIRGRKIRSYEALGEAKADFYTWNEYNETLLRRRFSTTATAEEYSSWAGGVISGYNSLSERVAALFEDVDQKLRLLSSIKGRLALFDEPLSQPLVVERRSAAASTRGTSIFIVHGHDEASKLAVHGFLREITSLNVVILHDQPSAGRTVIEKFEDHASDATFAVVLLTADDVGGPKDGEPAPRGRQNVVFELGFFFGALGRNRVAVLYAPRVERPSDIDGLLYIELDKRGAWKLPLAKELKAAGVEVNAAKLL